MAGQRTSFVRADAEKLLDELRNFNQSLRAEWSKVENQWKNVDDTWHDKQYEKYYPLFQKLQYIYQEAEAQCDKYIAFVDKEINIERKDDDLTNLNSVIDKM